MIRARGEQHQERTCARCGRRMQWRRAWARCWDEVRWCSAACRNARRPGATDRALETAIRALLAARAADASICPSEAARQVAGDGDWRALMEPARAAARRLAAAGELVMTQRGHRVDPATAKGPIRLRRVGNASPGSRP